MKKLTSLFLSVVLLSACSSAPETTNETNEPSAPSTQTYRYLPYGVSFEYPADWTFTAPDGPYNDLSDTSKEEDPFVLVRTPQNAYAGTNFGNANFGMSALYTNSLEDCLALPNSSEQGDFNLARYQSIGENTYYTNTATGAAAGNQYDIKYFRTYQNGWCFSATETVHTMNIGNYDPGTVTAVNEDEIWAKLDAILGTVKFEKMEN